MATNNSNRSRRATLPRGVYRRATRSGPVFMALVRLKGFKAVSKTFAARADAEAWADATKKELNAQRKRGEARADLPTLTVGGLVREYLADSVPKALRSYANKRELLGSWLASYGSKRVLDFGVLALRDARTKLQPGRAPATVNRHLSALRSAWNWGRNAGLVPPERAWPTKLMLREPKGRTRYLTDVELTTLLEASRARGPTFYAMIILSLATGARQGELLRLRWSDIDFERGRARILLTKNNESRAVHLPATVIEALRSLRRADVVGAKHVFVANNGVPFTKDALHYPWNVVRNAAGLTNFRWDDLRHSCASFLAQKGATLLEIGSVLGHKSPSLTMRYAHLVQGAPVTGHTELDAKLRGRP